MLENHEMIKVLHIVACTMVFNLLCDRGHQGEVLKLMKDDLFLVFLTVWVLFPKFLGMLKSGLY